MQLVHDIVASNSASPNNLKMPACYENENHKKKTKQLQLSVARNNSCYVVINCAFMQQNWTRRKANTSEANNLIKLFIYKKKCVSNTS